MIKGIDNILCIIAGKAKSNAHEHEHPVLDAIEFTSSDSIVYGPYGGTDGISWVSDHPGCILSYLTGYGGWYIDSLTLHYEC